jgi:hypothetical protein
VRGEARACLRPGRRGSCPTAGRAASVLSHYTSSFGTATFKQPHHGAGRTIACRRRLPPGWLASRQAGSSYLTLRAASAVPDRDQGEESALRVHVSSLVAHTVASLSHMDFSMHCLSMPKGPLLP